MPSFGKLENMTFESVSIAYTEPFSANKQNGWISKGSTKLKFNI